MARSWDEDEAQPLYFLVRLLICIVSPWTAALLWWVTSPGKREVAREFPVVSDRGHRIRYCQTAAMVVKREARMAQLRSRIWTCSAGFIFRTSLLLMIWVWLISLILQWRTAVAQNKLYEGFDPYKILSVDQSHGELEINRAFRKLALKYHPDKTQDPGAVEKFLLAKKAVDALTEPEAMENFKTYGNPDGPQFVRLFAIRSFIKDKDASRHDGVLRYKPRYFRAADLQLYLAALLVCLLACVGLLLCLRFTETASWRDGVLASTLETYSAADTLVSLKGPSAAQELLLFASHKGHCCGAACCRSRADADLLKALCSEFKPINAPGSLEALLLSMHFARREGSLAQAPARLKSQLQGCLLKWQRDARAMIEMAVEEAAPCEAVVAAIELHRCIVQALPPTLVGSCAGQLLQIPHVDEKTAHQLQQGRAKDLRQFLALSVAERRAVLAPEQLSQQQLLDVEEFAAVAPRMEICTAKVSAMFGKRLCAGGSGKLRIELRRSNLGKSEAAGPAHVPHFADVAVPEAWWVLMTFPGQAIPPSCRRLLDPSQEIAQEMEFEIPSVTGKCKCRLSLLCEVYAGLDAEKEIVFVVEPSQ